MKAWALVIGIWLALGVVGAAGYLKDGDFPRLTADRVVLNLLANVVLLLWLVAVW